MTPALIVGWMTQAIVVSALLALAALLLQKLAGRALPNRLIWSGALFSSLVLVLVAPLRMTPPPAAGIREIVLVGAPAAATPAPAPALWRVALHTWSSNVDRALSAPVQWSATTIGGALDRAPVAARVAVTAVWPLSTLLVLIAFGVSYRRHRAELARAELHDIDGVGEGAVHLRVFSHVHGQANGAVEAGGHVDYAVLQALVLVGEGELGSFALERLGDAVGDGTVAGEANDECALAGHESHGSSLKCIQEREL